MLPPHHISPRFPHGMAGPCPSFWGAAEGTRPRECTLAPSYMCFLLQREGNEMQAEAKVYLLCSGERM